MNKLPVTLTETHVRKLVKGHPIQISKDNLHNTQHYLVVHPETYKRAMQAKSKGKGLRITLTHPELVASGDGFMDILNKIKDGANWFKKNVIDSNFYQANIKPELRSIVNAGVDAISPMLPAPIANIGKVAVDRLGQATNAFGINEFGIINTSIKPKRITKANAAKMLKSAIAPETVSKKVRISKPKAKRIIADSSKSGSFLIN